MAIVLDGSNLTTTGVINSGTAVASTSGTSIDFTDIPAGVKRITVMFSGLSTNGTSLLLVQLGAGSVTTTGYISYATYQGGITQTAGATSTSGFYLDATQAAATLRYGSIVFTKLSANTWVGAGVNGNTSGVYYYSAAYGGSVTLAGTLDRIRITTVNGTDTFDAGSINILYE